MQSINNGENALASGELSFYDVLRQYFPAKLIVYDEDDTKRTFIKRDNSQEALAEYLGRIEVQLNLRNLSIPDKTLKEIGIKLGVQLDESVLRSYKKRILEADRELYARYEVSRARFKFI